MNGSFRIARVAGIDVKIHVTFFLILVFYGWLYYADGGWVSAVGGVVFVLLLFLCVLLHEFGHAFAARAFGIRTPDITLLPIGGVARLERMPHNPTQELVIAIAGPAVNVVIALLLLPLVVWNPGGWDVLGFDDAQGGLAGKLLSLNIVLVAFNLIPAFPMDGGRVLRALLATSMPHPRATRIAARVGQVIAVLFIIAGFMGNPILILIAMFVYSGAQQELAYSEFMERHGQNFETAGSLTVGSLMISKFETLPGTFPAAGLPAFLSNRGQRVFPVVDDRFRVLGIADRSDLVRLGEAPYKSLLSVTRRVPVLAPELPATSAMETMRASHESVLPVVNPSGQIVGLVTSAALVAAGVT
jgi:Zn-dependent protease/CBS domain-containing protein